MVSEQAQILVVDDDRDIREAVAAILEAEGFVVAEAGNGQEALDYLRSHVHPALILLDLMMPVMDGWAFRAIQRSDPDLASIPVLVFSASAQVNGTLPVEPDRFLKKPVELSRLLSAIRSIH